MGERRALGVAIVGLLVQGVVAMYADDVGKLDWHRQNIGRFASAIFDGRGGLTVVGETSTLASVDSLTGELAWRQVLTPEDAIVAASAPAIGVTPMTVTVSSGGKIVRQWSPVDGSLLWEVALGIGAGGGGAGHPTPVEESTDSLPAGSAGGFTDAAIVSTDEGFIVVISATGIHVLSGASGTVLAQWSCNPALEPDLAALVGGASQVTFTSLRLAPDRGGTLLAGGWSSRKGGTGDMEAFVVAEISPSERVVKFKTAQMGPLGVDPSSGIVMARSHGEGSGGKGELVAVGLCKGGTSLSVFAPSSKSPATAVEIPLRSEILGGTTSVSRLADLAGTDGAVLELRQRNGGTMAITLTSRGRLGTGSVSVVEGTGGTKKAYSCPASDEGGCALAGGISQSGKTFVASASMTQEGATEEAGGTTGKLMVSVAEVSASGDFMAAPAGSFETDRLASLGRDTTGLVQAAFLEVAEGEACAHADSEACFRVLAVHEDDSAVMIGQGGLEWVREEALAAVDKVVFVDSSKDELAILAASGQKVEHEVPGWRERLNLQRLDIMMHVAGAVRRLTGVSLPGSELLEEADVEHSAFGLKKYAVCTTKVGKMYALDMADGAVAWSIFRPSWVPMGAKILLYATRPKGALGYNPEVVVIAAGEHSTVVSGRDALTGKEVSREELGFAVVSALPLGKKDSQDRAMIMLVDRNKRVHPVSTSAEASAALVDLIPQLYYHNLSETGLESFAVLTPEAGDEGGGLTSAPVASVPFHPTRSKMVAIAYPDMRDGVPTPAHALGDDSLLIKYINPRLLAFAMLSKEEAGLENADGGAGASSDKGQELTVTLLDYVSGRILHRVTHKGASEPVQLLVSESWVVCTYWSAVSQRTEISTLSLYEGMIDKYGLSPFNRPEWKEDFTSFESRAPIVLQQTFIFPYPVTTLGVTLSQQGITAKNILVGTKLGQVVSVDRRFLDPRRPLEEPSKEQKDEKLIQYTPYLPVVPNQVLSYYKVIERLDRVLTEPTGLESTSLVLALGLDIFGTRVAPSKTYDILDPNFNYALLVLVLGAMTAAVLVAGRLASNKRLKDQWA